MIIHPPTVILITLQISQYQVYVNIVYPTNHIIIGMHISCCYGVAMCILGPIIIHSQEVQTYTAIYSYSQLLSSLIQELCQTLNLEWELGLAEIQNVTLIFSIMLEHYSIIGKSKSIIVMGGQHRELIQRTIQSIIHSYWLLLQAARSADHADNQYWCI